MKRKLSNKLSWVVLFVVLGAVIAGGSYMMTNAVSTHLIISGSMEPTVPQGSYVVTIPTNHLEKRDIITFHDGDHVVTHTFIGYDENGNIMTKGDANATPDDHIANPIKMSDVIGKVLFDVPLFAPTFWLSIKGLLTGIVIIAMLYFVFGKTKKGIEKELDSGTHEETRELHPV